MKILGRSGIVLLYWTKR